MNAIYHWSFPAAWWAFMMYWMLSAFWVRNTRVMESPLPRMVHYLAGAVAFSILAFHGSLPEPMNWKLWPQSKFTFWTGAAVMLAGLGFAVWARIHLGRFWSGSITLKEGHRLIRSGPYQFVRNPIYTGILTGVAGTAIALAEICGLVTLAILFADYFWKIRREERLLATEFGEEYKQYRAEVNALVPRFPKKA